MAGTPGGSADPRLGQRMSCSRCRETSTLRSMSWTFSIEVDQETDGRWIAEVSEIPGALAYGATRVQAVAEVQALVLRVLADRLEHGEMPAGAPLEIAFVVAA